MRITLSFFSSGTSLRDAYWLAWCGSSFYNRWVYLTRFPSDLQAPLADGTFIIINGAKFGVAGFASATDPNLTPVLYNPFLPVGARMLELASTPIARLYHSEAALMLDASVLVSGSDPRDPNFPQEYRHERFLPPYLLNGLLRPGFSLPVRDWQYKLGYQITLKGTASRNMQVILVGGKSFLFCLRVEDATMFLPSCLEYARQHHVFPHSRASPQVYWIRLHCIRPHQCQRLPTRVVHALRPRRSHTFARPMDQNRWRPRPARQLAPWSRVHSSWRLKIAIFIPIFSDRLPSSSWFYRTAFLTQK